MSGAPVKEIGSMRAVFTGCARDVGEHLPRVLANMSRLAAVFGETAFVFVENDSKDNTKQLLETFKLGRRVECICLDGLAKELPLRTERLARCRNEYVGRIKSSDLAEFDVMLTLDLDEMSVHEIDIRSFENAIEFLFREDARAAVFANQIGTYYDMWALRHAKRCPGDIWEDVLDFAATHNVSDAQAFERKFARRIFSLSPQEKPLKVESAFGGLGVYKMAFVVKNEYEFVGSKVKKIRINKKPRTIGWQTCEHVPFHLGLGRLGGKLYIDPALINGDMRGISFPPSTFRAYTFPLE